MKRIKGVLGLLIMVISLAGCGDQAEETEKTSVQALTEEIPDVEEVIEAIEEVATEVKEEIGEIAEEASGTEVKNLQNLEDIVDEIDEMSDYFEDITEDEDDMALLGDSMFMGMLGMKFNNVLMDQAMSGSGDTWEILDDEMPNGRGKSDSTMTMDAGVYTYAYANKWDDGYDDTTSMIFDTANMTVHHVSKSANPNNTKTIITQVYLSERGLFIASSEYVANNEMNTQYVIFYDGTSLNYGVQEMKDVTESNLPVDIVTSLPSGWEDLISGNTFEKMFVYDGQTLSYTHP